ncbi:MAG: methylmalonyl-CoA mutase small subunit [Bacteroidaceae bacterium]|nr:methylmalonyl-CoA mutase small subunit [Bacteroidaceae bacterium]
MNKEREKLFEEFKPVSTDDWKNKIVEDLKGADYDKKMIWRTVEGFNVKPFYRQEDIDGYAESVPGVFPYTRGNRCDNKWHIRQDISTDDVVAANEKARTLLEKGVTSLGFNIKGRMVSADFIASLLQDIDIEKIELNFRVCIKRTTYFAELFVEHCKNRGCNLSKICGSIEYDPIDKELVKNKVLEEYTTEIKQLLKATEEMPHMRCITVNAIDLCNSGAYITQELGYALAWGNEYLNAMTETGIPADTVAKKIKFNFGVSSNFFMEIAKFRAARTLWAKIVKEYQPTDDDACKMIIHAETSSFNLTLFDPYVNMLRTQTEAMSAVLAGIESLTVKAYDSVYETPTEFAERIAKNQQLILKHESHLDKVTDPAGGSYYIESLTRSIANEAWKIFLATEENGGFHVAVKNGEIQKNINDSGDSRRTALAKRREILLGTNQYPNFSEMSEGHEPLQKFCCCGKPEEHKEGTLNMARLGVEFEELRLATERSGKRPKAFMLTIGNLAMRQARAQFSCNFLAVAGYEVIDNLGFKSVEEGVSAAIEAKADIVVICSSDDEYAEYAIPAYQQLNNRAIFIVAGAPACSEELQKAGIENFIHVRVNVLETLKTLNSKLGI